MLESVVNFGEIRKATKIHFKKSEEGRQSGDRYPGRDRHHADEYLERFPKVEKTIIEYFRSLSAKGERIVHVDVCGRATAERMGAAVSYCFSLAPSDFRKRLAWSGTIFIDGDIFSSKDFSKFIRTLRQDAAPALITFEPVAGLGSYESFLGRIKATRK